MKRQDELPDCPVATAVSLIGSKWKLLILRNLLVRPWRFNELQKSLEGISQKVLTDSLRSMEADGIVIRSVFAEVPPYVELCGVFSFRLRRITSSHHKINGSMGNELQTRIGVTKI